MVEVSSMNELDEVVRQFREKSKCPCEPSGRTIGPPITWFRGQSNSNYPLIPSLYRLKLENNEMYKEFEVNAISNYMEKCRCLGVSIEDTSWDIFYSMQHYGVKTRALDWSESYLIGLFFAFEKWNPDKNDAALYLLDPVALNFIVTGNRDVMVAKDDDEKYSYGKYLSGRDAGTIAVEPRPKENAENLVNKRILKQKGRFTLHETKWPLEAELEIRLASRENRAQYFSKWSKASDVLLKVNLKKQVYSEVRELLLQNGIDHTYVYPDIEGVAHFVNRSSLPKKDDWYNYQ